LLEPCSVWNIWNCVEYLVQSLMSCKVFTENSCIIYRYDPMEFLENNEEDLGKFQKTNKKN